MDAAIASGKGVAGLPGGGAKYVAHGMAILAKGGSATPSADVAPDAGRQDKDNTQVASASTSMNDASGPPPPPQTQADYYRANYDSLIQDARDQATRLHPDDPTFADLAASRRQQTLNKTISIQQKSSTRPTATHFGRLPTAT